MNYKQKEQDKKRLTSAQIGGAEDMAMADPPQRHPPVRARSLIVAARCETGGSGAHRRSDAPLGLAPLGAAADLHSN